MKRVGYLYSKICDKDNIRKGIINACKHKKKSIKVNKILNNLEHYVDIVYNLLTTKTYHPKPYIEFDIVDKGSKKVRHICKPTLIDHSVQWAIMQVLQPIIMRGMDIHCCCNIKGRGTLCAAKTIEHYIRKDYKGTRYCLKLDIHHYFESIDQHILMEQLQRIIKDEDVLNLLKTIVIDDKHQGVPIGNYSSQWLANYYLQPLDHYIREELHVKYYVRYMDDLVILGSNKKALWQVYSAIKEYLKTLHLELKDNAAVFKVSFRNKNWKLIGRPVDFCGYKIHREHTAIRSYIFKQLRRSCIRFTIHSTLHRFNTLMAYYGYTVHSNSYYVTNKYHIREIRYGFNRRNRSIGKKGRITADCCS